MTVIVPAHIPAPSATISPVRISHCSIQTAQVPAMKKWYETVLGAATVYQSDKVCLLTFDDEHHRVALIHTNDATPNDHRGPGIVHIAMTYAKLGNLVSTYERLKSLGIKPDSAINHGPSTSLYYCDPDGNHLELLVDNFASVAELEAWFKTGAHERHPGGEPFDPEDLVTRYREGNKQPEVLT
ncbi:MAG: VOC family protein [Methyloceanibacter sp.]